jgi:hypothetical protein
VETRFFASLLSDSKHLRRVFRGEEMRRTFNKKAQKATHFMLLYETTTKKKEGKEKCFYSFALFYDKYHCFVPENVFVSHPHPEEHPFMPLPLEFLYHFLLCSLFPNCV